MEIQIFREKEKMGTIPYTSLPAYRLLCEQYGLEPIWQEREQILQLKQRNLKGRTIHLMSEIEDSDPIMFQFEWRLRQGLCPGQPMPASGNPRFPRCQLLSSQKRISNRNQQP